jgi:hypothetical protein
MYRVNGQGLTQAAMTARPSAKLSAATAWPFRIQVPGKALSEISMGVSLRA